MSLNGKVVLVTGASRGLGRAYLDAFANAGAHVVATARSFAEPDGAPPATARHARVVRWPCDVRSAEDVAAVVARTVDEFGHIDVLVNNAGVFPHYDTLDVTLGAWDDMMNINVRGTYLMIRAVVPHMVTRGGGAIVNLSSGSALHTECGSPGHEGLFPYSVSKAAIDRMTDYLGEELARSGIAVNALRPGGVLTEGWLAADPVAFEDARRTGRGQLCTAEVVGPPMLHLAQQTPAGLTGQVLQAREFGVTWP